MMSRIQKKISRTCAFILATSYFGCQHLGNGPLDVGTQTGGSKAIVLPADQGLLWLPLVWSVRLASEDSDVESPLKRGGLSTVSLRSLGLNLRSVKDKKVFFLKMNGENAVGSKALLENNNPSAVFYLDKFIALPDGDYFVEGLQATYVQPDSQKSVDLQFPLENPFQPRSAGGTALPLQIKNGKIAAIPRMAATTSFGLKDGNLVSLTELDPVDREVVPLDLVLSDAGFSSDQVPFVYAASRDLPRSRLSLSKETQIDKSFEPVRAKVGVLVEVPCANQGMVHFVWKRVGDDREYQSSFVTGQESCDAQRILKGVFSLPEGQWVLRSLHFVNTPLDNSYFKTAVLRFPSAAVKNYLRLSEQQESLRFVSLERELKKRIQIDLAAKDLDQLAPQKSRPAPFLFMGRFQLLPVEVQKSGSGMWDTVFKRTFSLTDVQSLFSEKEVINAYTLLSIQGGREKGTVQGVLKVTSAQSDAPKIEKFSGELRKYSTEGVAKCVTDREEKDPLVTAQGNVHVTGLKGGTALTLKEVKIKDLLGAVISSPWLNDCLRKVFLDFRFSKKLPASFQAEFQFKAD
jgi:hypothetical protein